MTISKKMQEAFNSQMTKELWSSNLYLAMAFWFRSEGWEGFGNWMQKQSEEEKGHAMAMAEYVLSRGGKPSLSAIDAVPAEWKDAQDAFEYSYKHEQKVTEYINKLADVADAEGDRASQNFIDHFIDEQVEEEKTLRDILATFKQYDGHAIPFISEKLGARK